LKKEECPKRKRRKCVGKPLIQCFRRQMYEVCDRLK